MARFEIPMAGLKSLMKILFVLVATMHMVSCLERSYAQDSKAHGRLAPVDMYPRNYYQLYHEMDPWKRAPSAGWFGMRGKKVPSSNFLGMRGTYNELRGKKGPSGFLGMRGKKGMDSFSQGDTSNELFPLVDSLEEVWTSKSGFEAEDPQADRNSDPREERILHNSVKANFGKINI